MSMLTAFLLAATSVYAQNPLSQTTQCEVGIGFTIPLLQSGQELMRSQDLRDSHLSYYEDALGNRKNVGSYSGLKGYSLNIGFYKPIKKAKGLMLGAMVRKRKQDQLRRMDMRKSIFSTLLPQALLRSIILLNM